MKNLKKSMTHIKNAYMVQNKYTEVPFGKMVEKVLKILSRENIIKLYKKLDRSYKVILYPSNKLSILKFFGKKNYCSKETIKKEFYKFSRLTFVTTDKGIVLSRDCIKNNIGGLPLFYIEK